MKREKKRNIIKLSKRIIQTIFFILLPGLFIELFSSIGSVVSSIAQGSFSFTAMAYPLFVIAAAIPLTIIMGRFFCSFMCAFGSMGDLVWFVSRKTRNKKIYINENTEKMFKCVKYVLLALIIVLVWVFGVFTISSDIDPWNIFGIYASFWRLPSIKHIVSLGGALLILIIIGSYFIERFFCRYLCPLGAFFSLISRLRIFKIKKPAEGCGSCRICTNSCPMGLPLYKQDKVDTGECINCLSCIYACPRHNISATISGNDVVPLVAGAVVAAAITGLYYVGTYESGNLQQSGSGNVVITEQLSNYEDGVYSGTGQGYKGEVSLQVTVEGGRITSINILSQKDDEQFFIRASSSVISQIIKSQSPDVDAVSGATFSSNGIMDAVTDALGIGGSETSANQVTPTPESGESNQVSCKDGTYEGSGTGFRGTTTVQVSVENGKIASIEVLSYKDDARFFERADDRVIDEIISQQQVQVDAVSGATFSSNGIMEAVADALGMDYDNPNSTMQQGGHQGNYGGKH
jgi:uncharacterized protein with FMN-binding domain